MTQEELDALMGGDIDLETLDSESLEEETAETAETAEEETSKLSDKVAMLNFEDYKVSASHLWPPSTTYRG